MPGLEASDSGRTALYRGPAVPASSSNSTNQATFLPSSAFSATREGPGTYTRQGPSQCQIVLRQESAFYPGLFCPAY